MSDKKRTRKVITYDYSKNLENLTINPSFINGLENVTSLYILNSDTADQEQVPETIKKFNKLMAWDPESGEPQPQLELNPYEQSLYVLFALTNYLKLEAINQEISSETEVEVDEQQLSDMQARLKDAYQSGDLIKELTEIGKSFQDLDSIVKKSS
jgi:hypothetical protein